MTIERALHTTRLLLRPWRADDAAQLLPVLEANRAHLGPWIPAHVSQPVALPQLEQRLTAFAAAFDEDREWRFGIFRRDDGRLLGEIDLFPRDGDGRVAFEKSNRAEIGYWLRADATGQGFASEAARELLAAGDRLGRFSHIEIRCNPRNEPSVAVAQRLGFTLAETIGRDPNEQLDVWTSSPINNTKPPR